MRYWRPGTPRRIIDEYEHRRWAREFTEAVAAWLNARATLKGGTDGR